MAERVIVESYSGYMKRKTILWAIPILFMIVSFIDFKKTYWLFIIGLVWLALLVYFSFFRKRRH